ncbi:type I glutamate--ammonia ligase [Euzebya tangerina]|uniref:type I glutamate--ammonia ligase n=1 Tax=Euzebya tangerina TaxID=591198 RepID=UPI000E3169B2|nr:type I glutamate--ammonia ligase [Euzebya tangerina]
MTTAEDVINRIEAEEIRFIDFRFVDLPGLMQHYTLPSHQLTEEVFTDGLGFDGSSVRGFQDIQESDMLLVPDASTAVVDPFRQHSTLILNCFVKDPLTGQSYSRDPRYIAQKAEAYLQSTGIADTCFVGPEAEFFIFDDVRFISEPKGSMYALDSVEAAWNTAKDEGPNLGHKIRYKQGYFPTPPADHFTDLRSEMVVELERAGIEVELQHHEVGTAGQAEIDFRFAPLAQCADQVMLFKYIVKNVAHRNGRSATFMPKPVFFENGSGMHTHMSLWKDDEPLFYDETGYAGLSELARHYIGGLLTHAPSILAFSNPTTNSYKRLVPGYEAPVNLVYSQRNRSAACRIPLISQSPKAKRVEFRVPDPSCNPYLAFSAMLMAGLDGIRNRIEPPDPVDKDIYELGPEALGDLPSVPASLEESLAALADDHEFLLEGGVFTEDLIDTHIAYKMESEVTALRLRPHPHEFELYYDI